MPSIFVCFDLFEKKKQFQDGMQFSTKKMYRKCGKKALQKSDGNFGR